MSRCLGVQLDGPRPMVPPLVNMYHCPLFAMIWMRPVKNNSCDDASIRLTWYMSHLRVTSVVSLELAPSVIFHSCIEFFMRDEGHQ